MCDWKKGWWWKKEVDKEEIQLTNEVSSDVSKPQVDHFDEFGPVLALRDIKFKRSSTPIFDENEKYTFVSLFELRLILR